MDKNAQLFLGLAVIGGAAFYFVKNTESTKKSTSKDSTTPPDNTFTPPNNPQAGTKPTKIQVATNVAKALADNENAFIYNGKIVWLNKLLQLGFQYNIDKYTKTQLWAYYKAWKKRTDQNLPYGDVNKGSIDRYIADLLLGGAALRKSALG